MYIHIICVLVYVEVQTHKSMCVGEPVCARHTILYVHVQGKKVFYNY